MHIDQVGGLPEVVFVVGNALGLDLLQQGVSLFELAGEALAVEAQVG